MGINKAIIIGNLGRDPEMRALPSGGNFANLRIATNEKWTDKNGDRQERTEWHAVVCFGKLADTCERYLSKGRQVYVEGRIQTREWQDKDGNKRWSTEIVANTIQFLSGGERGGMSDGQRRHDESKRNGYQNDGPQQGDGGFGPPDAAEDDGEIPF